MGKINEFCGCDKTTNKTINRILLISDKKIRSGTPISQMMSVTSGENTPLPTHATPLYLLSIVRKRRALRRVEGMQMAVQNVEAKIAHLWPDD